MEDLQHPLLKVPCEHMSQRFRLFHKLVSRDVASLGERIRACRPEQASAERAEGTQTLAQLDVIAERIRAAKQRVTEFAKTQAVDADACVRRTRFMKQQVESATTSSVKVVGDDGRKGKMSQGQCDESKRDSQQDRDLDVHDMQVDSNSMESLVQHRLVADYLLCQGHMETAKLVQHNNDMEHLLDFALHEERQAILKDLEAHDVSTAVNWCNENASKLRRMQSTLEFQLRLQEFIELVRADKKLEAIQHAQAHLAPISMQQEDAAVKKGLMNAIQEAMATLAYQSPETCGVESYSRLFSMERWNFLKDAFHETFCNTYGMHNPPSLFVALYAGLSTLNTRTCQRKRKARAMQNSSLSADDQTVDQENDSQTRKKSRLVTIDEGRADTTMPAYSEDAKSRLFGAHSSIVGEESSLCPTCSSLGDKLCSGLPLAPHPHSHLLCRVTHKAMDEHNPPIALPNGHVYSRRAIEQMTTGQGKQSMVTCAVTREVFALADTTPVYIL